MKTEEGPRELPDDITISIFKILPIKALVRFLCVSKSFTSLIYRNTALPAMDSNQPPNCFCKINHGKNRLVMYPEGESDAIVLYDFPFKYKSKQHPHVVSSCNGVFCVVDKPRNPSSIYLWNPSIHKSLKIPNPNFQEQGLLGFGHDSASDDYKLVRVVDCNPGAAVEIYSLKRNNWRKLKISSPKLLFLMYASFPSYAFVNGACHWLLRVAILSFHLGDEEFRVLALPDCLRSVEDDRKLVVIQFKETIAVVQTLVEVKWRGNDHNLCIPVWIMKKYGNDESWIKLFNIDLGNRDENFGLWKVLGFRRNDEVVLLRTPGRENPSELVLYKKEFGHERETLTYIGKYVEQRSSYIWANYRESLALVNVGNWKRFAGNERRENKQTCRLKKNGKS